MTELLLHDMVRATAGRTPHRVAVSYRDGLRTYGDLIERIEQLTAVLAARGIGHGARVIWWGDTHLDAGTLYYALAHLGAVFVPLNPRFSAEEFRTVADIADPDLVVADEHHLGDVTLEQLLAQRSPSTVELPRVHELDPDVIFFTSGTTGLPKGCVLSHRSNCMRTYTATRSVGSIMTMFPQFHWGGWSFCHGAWYLGQEYALVDGGNTGEVLETMARRQVASFYGIPAIWRRILEADRSGYDLSALREANTGTSSTPPELLAAIADAFPATSSWIGYGATEAGGLCQLPPQDIFRKPGSVGLPSPGMQVRLEDGELWVKSAQAFLGYFRNPEATAAAVVDGWYRTGDLVERDDEGYMWVVGRVKDIIRTGGESVAPAEVDVVVQRHPSVADAAVAGVPDDDWGEVVTAFVVLRPGTTLELAQLRQHCGGSLAAYKHPRQLVLVDEIPRTGPTGQVQRRRLVDMVSGQAVPD
jgi:acyl-CoA synthetase (AMP-forming)/AMP-acid ligase II